MKMKHYPAMKHGSIEQISDGIWFVQGTVKMPMFMPMKISRAMTVVKDLKSHEIILINSMRLNENGLKELGQLGQVKHVIRIAGFHGRDDGFYRDHFGAKIWAFKGQSYVRKLGNVEGAQTYLEPDYWIENENDPFPISDAKLKILKSSKPTEALVLLERNGTLISGDALQNTPKPDHFVNWFARKAMKKMGFFKAYNVGPGWLQFAKPSTNEIRSILELDFNHVLPGHGNPVINQAKKKYEPAILGELKGCHS